MTTARRMASDTSQRLIGIQRTLTMLDLVLWLISSGTETKALVVAVYCVNPTKYRVIVFTPQNLNIV